MPELVGSLWLLRNPAVGRYHRLGDSAVGGSAQWDGTNDDQVERHIPAADRSRTVSRHRARHAAADIPAPWRAGLDVLVETKLYSPRARRDWVPREELVAQWHLSPTESRPFAWVSLDRGDNDPGRLWRHVAYALQRACPQFSADDVLALVRGQPPDFAGTLLPLLIELGTTTTR